MSAPQTPSPYELFRTYLADTARLVTLTYEGVQRIQGIPALYEVLANTGFKGVDADEQAAAAQAAQDTAELASAEIASNFALLHAHALMGAWGALESLVENVADFGLENNHDAILSQPLFQRIKISVGVYESMTPVERRSYLISEAQREVKVDFSLGVGQFEGLLKELLLGGSVDPQIRRSLLHAQQIRHLIAHRGGRADSRFLKACPDLGYKVGDHVQLSPTQFHELILSMVVYGRILDNRCRVLKGLPPSTEGLPEEYLASAATESSDEA